MKRISFFLALALIVASFGLASASSISLESTTGTWDDGGTTKIIPGATLSYDLRVTNTEGVAIAGMTNGFQVSGGAYTMTGTMLDSDFNSGPEYFDLVWAINEFGDVTGFGGSKLGGSGLPAGYDNVAYRLTVAEAPVEGETICLDSTFYPPSGSWLWAGVGSVDWDGPHCFLVETPACLPPANVNAPLSMNGSHCDVMTFDFDADLNPVNIPQGTIEFSADLGTIDAVTGAWSYAPTLADVGVSMSVTVTIGNGVCSEDYVVNLTFTNEAPVAMCPGDQAVSTGSDNSTFVTASDDCDPYTFSIEAGDDGGTGAVIDPNTGEVTFNIAGAGNYTIIVTVTDGNESSTCSFMVNAVAGSLFQVEIPCVGDQSGNFVFQGQHVSVPVNLTTGNVIGGYDLLIAYDNSALSFQTALPGADILAEGWEYFTYRYGANGNCSNACPSGLLRLTAIAETNNGPNHPSNGGVIELAVLDFLVTNDRTFECSELPIRFFWMDCGDNALSNWTGDTLFISEVVFDGDPGLFPPNGNEIQNENYGYPTYFGAQADCDEQVKQPTRAVSFNNGCVFVACADSIDARGDLNLNNVSNEIADAVLYSNYFVYGIGVFTINTEGQIAASDVNADGLSLSVADLVYLVRIIVGDALPYPKLAAVEASVTYTGTKVSVDAEMGAALVVIEGNVQAELLADGMTIESAFDGVNTRVLVYSLEGNSFAGDFLNANGTIISVEFGSFEGATVSVTSKIVPENFSLYQNYPNPFNPSTTISFALPTASDYSLTVYNVTGQKVSEFAGTSEAGTVNIEWDASAMASGIYFYKLNAGNFSNTKKMVLLR